MIILNKTKNIIKYPKKSASSEQIRFLRKFGIFAKDICYEVCEHIIIFVTLFSDRMYKYKKAQELKRKIKKYLGKKMQISLELIGIVKYIFPVKMENLPTFEYYACLALDNNNDIFIKLDELKAVK